MATQSTTIHHVTGIRIRSWCVDQDVPVIELVIVLRNGAELEIALNAEEGLDWNEICRAGIDSERPTDVFAHNVLAQAFEHAIAERRAIEEARR